jgi:tRNA(fMet)-specific endonuclease VapC
MPGSSATRYALDTNSLSYALRRHGGVAARLSAMGPARIAVPSVVIFELQYGLAKVGRQRELDALEAFLRPESVLHFDDESARRAASARVALELAGIPIGLADLLIAGTALAHGCTLVTHNTREFARVPGLLVEDWY